MVNGAPSAAAVLATEGTLVIIAFIMIAARFYLRFKIHEFRRLLVSDVLMGAAWCAGFTTATFDIVLYKNGALEPEISYTLNNFAASTEDYEYVAKMVWASVIPFYATLYLCKLSLLAVYFQVFPAFLVKLQIALWVTFGFCISSWVISMSLQLFLCWPIEGNWRISKPETLCSSVPPAIVFRVGWALHFTGSIAGVYGALSLGAVDIAFSLTRFLIIHLTDVDDFRSISTIELWSALDMMVGLIVTCLPSLRPYFRQNFKSSSASHTHAYHSNIIGSGRSITVARRVTTSNISARWSEHGQFEELEGGASSKSVGSQDRIVTIGNDVRVDGGSAGRNSWQEDKRSHHSDVELIHMGKNPAT